MSAIEYVSGTESHTSSWGKFYVKGLEKLVVKEDHARNERGNHASYQCYVGSIPAGTVFTVFEQSGDKRGTDTYTYRICQADPNAPEINIESAYGSGMISGRFVILAQANSKVKAPRLMGWWDARPADIDPATWAQHCAAHIDKRGLAEIPALVAE